ncbi:type II secretion system protein [Microbacterium sp. NEAU-LLC]|uniref:Type II secretion system protein n=1 Tax=Microbacterium helvum TaxID=2773713 RepID=A0ABR8NJ23_9MICO|nr:type II secretion system protein [Microbacterium helvum]MBD3940681.1 type II secretion system protein [Microbacterium helvum]
MRGRGADAAGFSLVEVIIAMFVLGIIALALLPALINGIQYSSQQSTVATATRQLNAIVEDLRHGQPTCADVINAGATQTFQDGARRDFTVSGAPGECTMCPIAGGEAISLDLTAERGGRTLARVSALVYVQGAKADAACSP